MSASKRTSMGRGFAPMLAGASTRDRFLAAIGALIGIALTGWSGWWIGGGPALPLLVAPIGASAVLVFAVPASPLAQPWPVIGGNVASAIVGITVSKLLPMSSFSAALAVGIAILVMSALRCLHPPGGAAALTGVIGGHAVASAGYAFPLIPVGVNSAALVLVGLLYHRLSGHSYPHRALPVGGHKAPPPAIAFDPEDMDLALAEIGETFDVSRDDLQLLYQRASSHAARRRSR